MQYEKIVNKTKSYSINISASKPDSVRISEDKETSIRVYSNGKIGVAGCIGDCDDNSLLEKAKANLSQGIPYPCSLRALARRTEGEEGAVISDGDVLPACRSLLKSLTDAFPGFIFSNKFNSSSVNCAYSNSLDVQYGYASSNVTVSLAVKAKNSANIVDLMYSAVGRRYNESEIVGDVGALLNVYDNKVDIPRNAPVLISEDVIGLLLPHLVAEKYVSGSSVLNGGLGFRIFNERVNIGVDRTPGNNDNIPFFDCEGTTLPGDRFPLVKDGLLSGLITYRRSAANLRLPLSGSARADYDGVPAYSAQAVKLYPTGPHLKTMVRGKAIYIAMTNGGDMTQSGDISLPVLLAYVYEDGRLTGVLPQFTLGCNVFDLLGKNFMGAAKNDVFRFADETLIVARAKIDA